MREPDGSRAPGALGTAYGVAAYAMWGLFPIYWKALSSVDSFQILAHRVAWAFVFSLILALATGRGRDLASFLRSPRRLLASAAAGFLVTLNWGIYIWAVNSGRIIESSLGYYLNPLVSVLIGATLLREKIDKGMIAASAVALVGIGILTVSYGRLPWVSLSLAVTFAVYGYIKKKANLDSINGLAAETAFVFPLALVFLAVEHTAGKGSFWNAGAGPTVLLTLAGPITAIPLMLYAAGVRLLPLSRMGFLQYLSPTLQLSLGVLVYGERLEGPRALAFGFILAALTVFLATRRKAAT
ncbi:MAG: EamA family transporter RarD [Spirochaetia bacterium]|nr:EamA family transporter RarD [Spirochaetia bacterium]